MQHHPGNSVHQAVAPASRLDVRIRFLFLYVKYNFINQSKQSVIATSANICTDE